MMSNNPHTMCNTLMLSHVSGYLPTSRHHAWACSAGSKGYCATKDMLHNGIPGHTLLIESRDLRDVEVGSEADESGSDDEDGSCSYTGEECCAIYEADDDIPKDCDEADFYAEGDDFKNRIPTDVSCVYVHSNAACLPQQFLKEADITSINLSALSPSQLSVIRREFLSECVFLSQLDMSPFSQLAVIHDRFLAGCTGLKSLDLTPLVKLREIHGSFLSGCSGLTKLDLSPLHKLVKVQNSFLAGCSGLTELDLSPLSQVTEVQGYFLNRCSGLTTLDISPLSKIQELSFAFLIGCSGLAPSIDLGPLSSLKEVHGGDIVSSPAGAFLRGCTGITSVENPSPSCPPPSGWVVKDTPSGTSQWVRM